MRIMLMVKDGEITMDEALSKIHAGKGVQVVGAAAPVAPKRPAATLQTTDKSKPVKPPVPAPFKVRIECYTTYFEVPCDLPVVLNKSGKSGSRGRGECEKVEFKEEEDNGFGSFTALFSLSPALICCPRLILSPGKMTWLRPRPLRRPPNKRIPPLRLQLRQLVERSGSSLRAAPPKPHSQRLKTLSARAPQREPLPNPRRRCLKNPRQTWRRQSQCAGCVHGFAPAFVFVSP